MPARAARKSSGERLRLQPPQETSATPDEQGIRQGTGQQRRRRGRPRRTADPGRRAQLHDAAGTPAAQGRADPAARRRAARGRAHGLLGRLQRRPLGKRRLHLRQEAAARDRSPDPFPDPAPGPRRSGRPGRARRGGAEHRSGLLRRHRALPERRRRGTGTGDRRHRRGRSGAPPGKLGVADRARSRARARATACNCELRPESRPSRCWTCATWRSTERPASTRRRRARAGAREPPSTPA